MGIDQLLEEVRSIEETEGSVMAMQRLRAEPMLDEPMYHAALGTVLARSGALPAAADAFEQAVVLAPADAALRSSLAAVLLELADSPDGVDEALTGAARDHLAQALNIDPNLGFARASMGLAQMMLGENEAALATLDLAVADDPGLVVAWFHRAVAQEALGDQDACADSLRRVLELDPDCYPAAEALESMGLA